MSLEFDLNKKNGTHDDCHDDNCHCHDKHTDNEHHCHDDECSCHNHKHNHGHSSHDDACGCGHDHGCGCGCEHGDDENLTPRLILGAVLFIAGIMLKNIDTVPYYINILVFVASYIVLGYDVVLNAIKGISKGHMFNENFLMSIASIGAFLIGEQPEAVAVMLFYQVGEMLQDRAVDNSRKSIRNLMDLRPDYVSIEDMGEIKEVNPNDVGIGDVFVVKQGQRLALDGIVTDGETYLDTSALTGESVPCHIGVGDEVLSGSINTGSTIHVKATKEFSQSTVSKILDMVEHAQEKKSQSEKFITTFARYYTPIVCALALLVILIPSIVTGDVKTWLMRGLTFLVVSCPCALVISIPLGFFAGLGCASKNQVLIKGGNYLEMLSTLDTVVFDKTGTLTKGDFEVIKSSSDEALKTATYAEFYSDHPIAKSVKSAFSENIDQSVISEYSELAGMGIQVKLNGDLVLAGNKRLMDNNNITVPQIDDYGTIIYVARDNKYLGYIVISDEIKETSKETVTGLNRLGIKTAMLTGDKEKTAMGVAKELNIKNVAYELLPQDKVAYLEKIMNGAKKHTAFVGDGINDAPVLMRADIGIAMGGIGTDSAIDASDVVLMDDKPIRILKAIEISKHTLSIIRQNIIFALSIKVIIMILSALGIANMWLAIFGDVGVALIAILNSMRALNVK